VRNKLIITAAVGVMAAATLTVNAQNAAGRTIQARSASAVALLNRTVSADRDDEHLAVRATASTNTDAATGKPTAEAATSHEAKTTPSGAVSPAAVTTGCTAAIANLKALHQRDVAEDANERATASGEASRDASASTADRTEDVAEAQQWLAAVKAAHTACLPATTPTNCQAAISGLQPVLAALRAQEQAEASGTDNDAATDFSAIRGAFSAIAMACARPE
jgi:hypothetical protein